MNHTHELRVHRRTHQLTQEELAHLLGVSSAMILRMEQGARPQLADLEATLALEVVFGKAPSAIFSGLYAAVEEAVMLRAAELEGMWRRMEDPKAKTKLALLREMVRRAKETNDPV